MPKLLETYTAILRQADVNIAREEQNILAKQMIKKVGLLRVYESQRLLPGKMFITFTVDTNSLQTAPGDIVAVGNTLSISTCNAQNLYMFRLLRSEKEEKKATPQLPQKFLHICEVCGKTELLSAEEAFSAGWDYPPRMGHFGVISPRTCGNCLMKDTVYWKVAVDGIAIGDLSDSELNIISRILNEPRSLMTDSFNQQIPDTEMD